MRRKGKHHLHTENQSRSNERSGRARNSELERAQRERIRRDSPNSSPTSSLQATILPILLQLPYECFTSHFLHVSGCKKPVSFSSFFSSTSFVSPPVDLVLPNFIGLLSEGTTSLTFFLADEGPSRDIDLWRVVKGEKAVKLTTG